MSDLESLKRDFEIFAKGVERLEELKEELNGLDTRGYEREVKAIESNLKKVTAIPKIERQLEALKSKIQEESIEKNPMLGELDKINLIERRIYKARLALMDFKLDESKRIYTEIMRIYNDLNQKNKSKVYQDIKDLYYEIKNAKKYGNS